MSIITGNHLGKTFGAHTIFTGISLKVEHGAKIGIVGPNGIGKSTLLGLISGVDEPTTGKVNRANGLKLGYLYQEAIHAFGDVTSTLFDEMHAVFDPIHTLEAQLRDLEVQMHTDSSQTVLEAYGEALEAFEAGGGYDYETRIHQTLAGLGFFDDDYATPIAHLSGGQKTRALLAKLLLQRPDVLILDEPTNHLDISAIQWLEKALYRWDGALIIVSHDRYFLDATVTTIWEMHKMGMETYKGNYTAYLKQREERHERTLKVFDSEMERFWNEVDFVERYLDTSNNDIAVGKLRRLTRDIVGIQTMGVMAYRSMNWSETGIGALRPMTIKEVKYALRSMPAPLPRDAKLKMAIRPAHKSGAVVLRTSGLEVGYPNKPLFLCDDIQLKQGEHAALIGDNGTGKTTFLKTLLNQVNPVSGTLSFGHHVKVGYFSQAHDSLNPDNTVVDELIRHHYMPISDARHHLARYLFRNEDVFKKVGDLSGGERGRLALAVLALHKANFLLLDEPTNHLDVSAQEILQEALENYEGTLLLVTHDRYLVDKLATQIWEIQDGILNVFHGTYAEYLEQMELRTA
ncbi:MAG: ATP-binding cassette domain-containing protein [Anaerolineae bacterium]|nr:ATP-binding cassette domain-containing protein [Anaerolineae bacterium]